MVLTVKDYSEYTGDGNAWMKCNTKGQKTMGFISRLLLGNEYEEGYDTAKSWKKQGGSYPAPDDTVLDICESGNGNAEQFYEGWRDYEDDQRGFISWLLGK